MTEAERLARALDLLRARESMNWRVPVVRRVLDAADLIRSQAAELEALRADAERLDWIAAKVSEKCGVWLLPCGDSLRFVQLRHFGECHNYPTVEGLRDAIDAAINKETNDS